VKKMKALELSLKKVIPKHLSLSDIVFIHYSAIVSSFIQCVLVIILFILFLIGITTTTTTKKKKEEKAYEKSKRNNEREKCEVTREELQ
jgi:large-conductance mechanosensitive channel